jgi:hypothetical protein
LLLMFGPKVRRESGSPDGQTTHQLISTAVRTRLCDFMWATANVAADLEENHAKCLQNEHAL